VQGSEVSAGQGARCIGQWPPGCSYGLGHVIVNEKPGRSKQNPFSSLHPQISTRLPLPPPQHQVWSMPKFQCYRDDLPAGLFFIILQIKIKKTNGARGVERIMGCRCLFFFAGSQRAGVQCVLGQGTGCEARTHGNKFSLVRAQTARDGWSA